MSDTNTPEMVGIPPTLDTDAEDVVWALQTAEALWKRNERVDAIVWLRRAAQSAGEAEDDDRALTLARGAAELAEWLAQAVPGTLVPFPSLAPSSAEPASAEGVEDLLRQSQAEIELAPPVSVPVSIDSSVEDTAPPETPRFRGDAPVVANPLAHPLALDVPVANAVPHELIAEQPGDEPLLEVGATMSMAPPDPEPTSKTESELSPAILSPSAPPIGDGDRSPLSVPTAAEAHAGMLDPWADSEKPTRPRESELPPLVASVPPVPLDDDEVMTSAPPTAPPPAVAPAPARRPPPVPSRAAPPLPPRAKPPLPPRPAPPTPPPPSPVAVAEAPAVQAPVLQAPIGEAPALESPPAASALDLSAVEAFADLPDDARDAFARAARVTTLARDEQVSQFALVFVMEGSVDVAATIVDAPAERLSADVVLRSRGTLDDHRVPMRLICGSDSAKVATWDEDAVAEAFRACSWVEDDLCAAGDRVQALVGLTMGPLGERLDASLRMEVTNRLTLRALGEGEVFAHQGAPVPGFLVVGAGELDLVRDDSVQGSIKAGDFLFASEMLGAVPAPATARAGKGGALVMTGDRKLAQELMVTCPPLLEIFAGM